MKKLKKIILLLLCVMAIPAFSYDFLDNQVSLGFYPGGISTTSIPRPPSPLYWKASTHADEGAILMYQHLIFHTQKYFSLYLGVSTAWWQRQYDDLYALSAFVSMRFWFFHTEKFNPYLLYSIAGPTIISQRTFGPARLGENFLFQDILGLGVQLGESRALNLEAEFVHYSNGDIFTRNSGFDVPIVFSIGYSF